LDRAWRTRTSAACNDLRVNSFSIHTALEKRHKCRTPCNGRPTRLAGPHLEVQRDRSNPPAGILLRCTFHTACRRSPQAKVRRLGQRSLGSSRNLQVNPSTNSCSAREQFGMMRARLGSRSPRQCRCLRLPSYYPMTKRQSKLTCYHPSFPFHRDHQRSSCCHSLRRHKT